MKKKQKSLAEAKVGQNQRKHRQLVLDYSLLNSAFHISLPLTYTPKQLVLHVHYPIRVHFLFKALKLCSKKICFRFHREKRSPADTWSGGISIYFAEQKVFQPAKRYKTFFLEQPFIRRREDTQIERVREFPSLCQLQ